MCVAAGEVVSGRLYYTEDRAHYSKARRDLQVQQGSRTQHRAGLCKSSASPHHHVTREAKLPT